MERLRNHSDFVSVLRVRHRVSSADVVAHYATREQESIQHAKSSAPRLGLAVANSVGNAVVRNTMKRRFRVLGRQYESLLPENCDVILRAKKTAPDASFASLNEQIKTLFSRIARQLDSENRKSINQ
ncbi:MAG: ribonuclease P protein component [Aeriscardovia sp.]|nr:ribonuclease P protein component [Aeriscardovia sp.]